MIIPQWRTTWGAAILLIVSAIIVIPISSIATAGAVYDNKLLGITLSLDQTTLASPGGLVDVNIWLQPSENDDTLAFDGFDLSIAYDSSVMTVWGVQFHQLEAKCNWWTAFINRWLDYEGFPSAWLRIYADASNDNSLAIVNCLNLQEPILTIQFRAHDDSDLFDHRTPVAFYWNQCSDNRFWSYECDTIAMAANIFDAEGVNITDYSFHLPSLTGPFTGCFDHGGYGDTVLVLSTNCYGTYVEFVSHDSVGARGDINLNGLSFEPNDIDLFSDYFLYGDSVFRIDTDLQNHATDINEDIRDTTLADLTAMYNFMAKFGPLDPPQYPPEAEFSFNSAPGATKVWLHASEPVGSYRLWLVKDVFQIDSVTFVDHGPIEMFGHLDAEWLSDTLRILALGGNQIEPLIDSGLQPLLTIYHGGVPPEPIRLESTTTGAVEFVEPTSTDVTDSSSSTSLLPTSPRLYQNYPNPFNPITTIAFDLPRRTGWHLGIFDATGRQVRVFSGTDGPCKVDVIWDGHRQDNNPAASGVYLYRLTAGKQTVSRKMVLVR